AHRESRHTFVEDPASSSKHSLAVQLIGQAKSRSPMRAPRRNQAAGRSVLPLKHRSVIYISNARHDAADIDCRQDLPGGRINGLPVGTRSCSVRLIEDHALGGIELRVIEIRHQAEIVLKGPDVVYAQTVVDR